MLPAADALWTHSPAAEMVVQIDAADTRVLRANRSCCGLLGMEEPELTALRSLEQFFEARTYSRFTQFSRGNTRRHLVLELRAADGRKLDVRFLRAAVPDEPGVAVIALQDLTEIQEDARALQAGYDEFIRITKELEDALAVIEKQNRLLEQQRNTMKQELVIAHRVQEHMFRLDFSQFQHVKAAGYYEAMEDLGGDMWEFHEAGGEFLGVLGDVMGHGVAASLISIAVKAHFKKYFEEHAYRRRELGALVKALNDDVLAVTDRRYFVTTAMVRIGPDYSMEFVTAGHPPILWVPARGPEQLLVNEQPMLGIFDNVEYQSGRVQLAPGDRVFLYTDCLTESSNRAGDVMTLERVGGVIRACSEGPERAVRDVLNFRTEFTGSNNLPDDLTLICIEVPEARATSVSVASKPSSVRT